MTTDLLEPVLRDGIRNVNFFNGRVVTGEAMQSEQKAQRLHRWKLGRAIGEGIVEGLEVKLKTSTLTTVVEVTSGLAFNREGQDLCLARSVEVSVVPDQDLTAQGDGLFVHCGPGATATPTGTGIYVLVLTPASGFEGQAPRVGLAETVARSCESRYVVEGVQFRLLHLDADSDAMLPAKLRTPLRNLASKTVLSATERSMLRNLLAHWCLGTVEAADFSADLLGGLGDDPAELGYGPLDRLRALSAANPNRLTDCDVPLAVLHWSQNHIDFVDMWPVRRRMHRLATSSNPPFPTLDRRTAEAEASFLHFQEQISEMVLPGTTLTQLAQTRLSDYFRFVPAVGVIPERVGVTLGFTQSKFFEGLTVREWVFIDGARARRLLRMSFEFEPIDLDEKEVIWKYQVRQNRETASGSTPPQPYVLFASGFIPYQGDAQFDLARWNFGNYGLGVGGLITTGE